MKRLISFLPVLFLSACATTNHAWTEKTKNYELTSPQRVVVFPIDGDMTGAVADALTTELMGMGFEVVERTNLSAILKEMKLEYGGALDQSQKRLIASASDATGMLFGSVKTTLSGKIYFMDLRFVDIRSGEILWSMNYFNDALKDARESMKEIAKSIGESLNCQAVGEKLDANSFGTPRVSVSQNPNLRGKKYNKIAIMRLGGTNYYGEDNAVYGALVTGFIGNDVGLVERKELDSIIKEQIGGEAGLYAHVEDSRAGAAYMMSQAQVSTVAYAGDIALSRETLSRISKLTGADALVMGSFQSLIYSPFDFSFANLRVLDLESGRIAWSASYYNSDVSPENYLYAADWLSIAISPLVTSSNQQEFTNKYNEAMKSSKLFRPGSIERLVLKNKAEPKGKQVSN